MRDINISMGWLNKKLLIYQIKQWKKIYSGFATEIAFFAFEKIIFINQNVKNTSNFRCNKNTSLKKYVFSFEQKEIYKLVVSDTFVVNFRKEFFLLFFID